MLSPEARVAAERLLAILVAFLAALAAAMDGTRRPLLTRLAARALAAYLERLQADLGRLAAAPAAPAALAEPEPAPAHTGRAQTARAEPAHSIPALAHAALSPLCAAAVPRLHPTADGTRTCRVARPALLFESARSAAGLVTP